MEPVLLKAQQLGFRKVGLCKKDEIVLNRGSREASNFFVFISRSKKRMCYWWPGRGLVSKSFRDYRELVEQLEAIEHAKVKPPTRYFVHLHGHWRSRSDDGLSSPIRVVRDLMLHHVDYDLSGFHNSLETDEVKRIAELEALVGISKGLAAEVSLPLPIEGRHIINGPHVMVWISKEEAAEELEQRFLSNRIYNNTYRAFCSTFDAERFMSWLEENKGAIAIGTPHPFFGFRFAGKFMATGILHFLHRWRGIAEFVLRISDGIAGLNSECRKNKVVPSNSVVRRMLMMLTGKTTEVEERADRRFAEFHKAEHRSFMYFEPDSHYNPAINYKRDTSPLGDGINYFESNMRKSPGDVVELLRLRKIRAAFFPRDMPLYIRTAVGLRVLSFHALLIAKQLI